MVMIKVAMVFQGGMWHQAFSSLTSAKINLFTINFTGTHVQNGEGGGESLKRMFNVTNSDQW